MHAKKLLQSLKQFREGQEDEAFGLMEEAEEDLRHAHGIHFQLVQRRGRRGENAFLLIAHARRRPLNVDYYDQGACGELLPIFQSLKQ